MTPGVIHHITPNGRRGTWRSCRSRPSPRLRVWKGWRTNEQMCGKTGQRNSAIVELPPLSRSRDLPSLSRASASTSPKDFPDRFAIDHESQSSSSRPSTRLYWRHVGFLGTDGTILSSAASPQQLLPPARIMPRHVVTTTYAHTIGINAEVVIRADGGDRLSQGLSPFITDGGRALVR